MFKMLAVLMGHLPYSLGPLSMTVGVVTLLPNEMAAMGANYFVWKNMWQIFNYFLRESAHYFEWITTRSVFSIPWEIFYFYFYTLCISSRENTLTMTRLVKMLCRNLYT